MSTKPSLKKTTREKINTVAVKTFEELTGSAANDKAKKQIQRKSKKLSKTITTLLKKENKKKHKAEKALDKGEKEK